MIAAVLVRFAYLTVSQVFAALWLLQSTSSVAYVTTEDWV